MKFRPPILPRWLDQSEIYYVEMLKRRAKSPKSPSDWVQKVATNPRDQKSSRKKTFRFAFFGTYDASTCPRVEVLKEGFAACGDLVLECNVPLRLDTAQRVRILSHPYLLPFLVWRVIEAWVRLWSRARSFPPVDAVVVGYMGHFDVHLARRIWKKEFLILDHLVSAEDTARDRGAASGRLQKVLGRLDTAAIRSADLCCVDTAEQAELIPDGLRHKTVVVGVGASNAWFQPPRAGSSGGLRVIFFGSYTPLQGAPVIGEAIAYLASVHAPIDFTMVGTGQDYAATRQASGDSSHVTWVDWVDPGELPSLVSSHDVCLGIFGSGRKALRVVPNKVFEGSAAGCAIITSDTEPQRRAMGTAAVFVQPGNPNALALALLDLSGEPARVETLKQAAYSRAQQAFRPHQSVEPLRRFLQELYWPS